MINKIKCWFGLHDFTDWGFYGFSKLPVYHYVYKRTCVRCGFEETKGIRRKL